MRLAVTGSSGRVGAALVRYFSKNHEVIPLPRACCDLACRDSLAAALERLECDVFLNPAAVTSLEACEDAPELAMRVNAEAPGEIAAWAAARGVPVLHFSTDYVFSGELPGLRNEEEIPQPLSVYGHSKLAGERAVLAFPANCVIRVAWVFGPEKPSFIDQVFRAALAGESLAAVADKVSLPVFTRDLAEWTNCLIETKSTGIIHACQSGEPASWHDLATVTLAEAVTAGRLAGIPLIQKQSLAEIGSFRAPRPRFTAMDHARLTKILGRAPRPWNEAVSEYVREFLV
jgi:dTDP-4-dehydrorhamnose reductase